MARNKLERENAELRRRLEEAEETLQAIHQGAVDAVVVEEPSGQRIYTLEGADRPYRLLVEEMHQGAATLQTDGTIAYCNRRLAELLEISQKKLVGASLYDFVAPVDRPIYMRCFADAQTGSGCGEVRLQCPEGDLVPTYLTFNLLPTDCGVALGVLITDLTTQHHYEALATATDALRASEEQLRFVMDSMPQKIFTARAHGAIDYFNPVWTQFTGLPVEQIYDWGWTQFVHSDDVTENLRQWRQSIALGEPFQFEHRFRRHDGEFRWHISRALPMRKSGGEVALWIGSSTEVHEQWETANQLRQTAAELSQVNRRKDEFLAMLAHELRNPLAAISNATRIVHDNYDGRCVRAASEILNRQVAQLVRQVDDLLDVSRISRGKIELRKERIELTSIVNHAMEATRPLCQSLGHELTVLLPSSPIYLDGDPMRLAQVVSNLLNNACKFTERGGRIALTVEREGEQALIRVRDSGIGLAPDELQRIFEIFAQVDRSLERTGHGLGLGLAIVKTLVEMHRGTVDATSAGLNKGSEFVVRLPAPSIVAIASPGEVCQDKPLTGLPRRILVADDNTDAAESLAMLLKLMGHEVDTARDGLEAVAKALAFRADIVLLDIGMPRLNGYEAARRIREQQPRRLRLVALTGWGQAEDLRRSKDAGFDAHLIKPVDVAALTKLLADAQFS